uniref:C3H1-type domain-containing protein n=1 Tax=Panagrolaimus sp. PS1159 TaxID=55785 RepID=A0AC35FC59_9BILA
MNNSPPNFNASKNETPTFKKSLKRVKFDKSVETQQITFKKEREHQKLIQAKLEKQTLKERKEQQKMDEYYRKINGISFGGNSISSPIPMDPFQNVAESFETSSSPSSLTNQFQHLNFGSSKFNLADSPSTSFSSSSNVDLSKPRISGLYKMQSTRFNSNRFNANTSHLSSSKISSSKSFGDSKRQKFGDSVSFYFHIILFKIILNSSTNSNIFHSSFKSSNNLNAGNSYKTRLCIQYRETQQCIYGKNCRYAHDLEELRLPVLPPQKMCHYILQNSSCPLKKLLVQNVNFVIIKMETFS